jgi:hypothetical protein
MAVQEQWARADFLQRESHQLDNAMRALQAQMVTILAGSLTAGTASAVASCSFPSSRSFC